MRLSAASVLLLLGGCSVQPHMQVRLADDPVNVDRDVRFRTTYYFRVFDQCAPLTPGQLSNTPGGDPVFGPRPETKPVVLNDSLYRFRMTGKAHSLTSRVHFESGSLQAWEIDPFGANVEYEPETGRFYPVTQQETVAEAKVAKQRRAEQEKLKQAQQRVNELLTFRRSLAEQTEDTGPASSVVLEKIDMLIADSLDALMAGDEAAQPSRDAVAAMQDLALIQADRELKKIKDARDAMDQLAVEQNGIIKGLNAATQPPSPSIATIPALQVIATSQKPRPVLNDKEWKRLANARDWYAAELTRAQEQVRQFDTMIQNLNTFAKPALDKENSDQDDTDHKQVGLERITKPVEQVRKLVETAKAKENACTNANLAFWGAKEPFEIARASTPVARPNPMNCTPPAELVAIGPSSNWIDAATLRDREQAFNQTDQALREAHTEYEQAAKELELALKAIKSEAKTLSFNLKAPLLAAVDPANPIDALDKLETELASWRGELNTATTQFAEAKKTADERRAVLAKANAQRFIVQRGVQRLAGLSSALTLASADLASSPEAPMASAQSSVPKACPEGTQPRRGFQIMGPEGFRTFDQDERLLMAMSSSGEPLINTLRELSSRVLNQRAGESDQLLPLANERVRILQALRRLDAGPGQDQSPEALVGQVKDTLDAKENN